MANPAIVFPNMDTALPTVMIVKSLVQRRFAGLSSCSISGIILSERKTGYKKPENGGTEERKKDFKNMTRGHLLLLLFSGYREKKVKTIISF